MQEREARLLVGKGMIASARIVTNDDSTGWNVLLISADSQELPVRLQAKRGGARVFKTSDAALAWCEGIGFQAVKVQFDQSDRGAIGSGHKDDLAILLVEDNEDDIVMTRRALLQRNIRNPVVVKRDGQEALDYLFGVRKDDSDDRGISLGLVLLDLKLPKVSGLEVLQAIRKHAATRLLPVVILTTSDEPADIRAGYAMGGNSYLRKPVDFDRFVNLVGHLGLYWIDHNLPPPGFRYRLN